MREQKIRIGIAYHKQCYFYKSSTYIPIQVGSTNSTTDLGIQKDSEGENISFENAYCSEMSATYWLWKNCTADYKGLFHYRRFLTFRKQNPIHRWTSATLYLLTKLVSPFIKDSRSKYFAYPSFHIGESEVGQWLEDFNQDLLNDLDKQSVDLYCCGYIYHSTYRVKTHLQRAVGYWHSEYAKKLIADNYPELNKYFTKTLLDNKFIGYNMLVAKDSVYDDYCKLIFDILRKYHEYMNNNLPKVINNAMLRDSGYIAELITDAYIRMIKDKGGIVKHLGCVNVDVDLGGMSYKNLSLLSLIYRKFK